MKRICFRGDDFGSCDEANRAIVQAIDEGVLRNVSVMVPTPAYRNAADLLGPRQDHIDIGLHVTLNAEWDTVKWGPLTDAHSLIDEQGHFLPTPMHFHQRGFDVAEAVAEVEAQLAALRATGLRVRYIDQHMGVGWVGGLEAELRRIAQREGLQWVDDLPYVGGADVEGFLAALAQGETDNAKNATHPGFATGTMEAYVHEGLEPGQVARERDADRRFLCDPALADGLARLGWQPARFSELS